MYLGNTNPAYEFRPHTIMKDDKKFTPMRARRVLESAMETEILHVENVNLLINFWISTPGKQKDDAESLLMNVERALSPTIEEIEILTQATKMIPKWIPKAAPNVIFKQEKCAQGFTGKASAHKIR